MGLAGKPEHPEAFIRFTVEGTQGGEAIEIYVAREIWARMRPETDRLQMLLPGHGQFELRFTCCTSA